MARNSLWSNSIPIALKILNVIYYKRGLLNSLERYSISEGIINW